MTFQGSFSADIYLRPHCLLYPAIAKLEKCGRSAYKPVPNILYADDSNDFLEREELLKDIRKSLKPTDSDNTDI